MLIELKINNFAIIENLHIQFKTGLNVISGETGAGKSIVLKSMALLMGAKASSDLVRTDCDHAVVEGCFDLSRRPDVCEALDSMGIDATEQTLIVRRIISPHEGKNRIFLNNSISTLNSLRDIVAPLIEIAGNAPLIELTGQHESRNLLSRSYHLDILDQHSGSWTLRKEYFQKYTKLKKLEDEIRELEANTDENQRKLEFLRFQRDEIKELNLQPNDDVELEARLKKSKHLNRILEFVEFAENLLYDNDSSIIERLREIHKRGNDVIALDPKLNKALEPLESVTASLEELVYELRDYSASLEVGPGAIEELEVKVSKLRKLQRKYTTDVEGLLKELIQIEHKIVELEQSGDKLGQIKKDYAALSKEIDTMAEILHLRRKNGAQLLGSGVNDELLDLNMKGTVFHISIELSPECGPNGKTDVEFMIKSSQKDAARPLARSASGGELSRILLAIKRIVGTSDRPRTYLFDEVDTGVSGPTAEKVGRKLKSIAKGQQVICVTHLPQVAACGDVHFYIQKNVRSGSAILQIDELDRRQRVGEIARLISGEKVTPTSVAHAKQLLVDAH